MRIGPSVLLPLIICTWLGSAWAAPLRLPDLLSRVAETNPELHALATEIAAREGAALQAGLRPNPELSLDLDNFAGTDELEGFESAEITLSLSQDFELGDKRRLRRQEALLEQELSRWALRSGELEILKGAARTFVEILATQRRLELSRELLTLAESTLATVEARVEAGKVSPVEGTRARIELASARAQHQRAGFDLDAARQRLGAFSPAQPPAFDTAEGELDFIAPLPSLQALEARLPQTPQLARLGTALERQQAALRLADARKIPDLNLSLGVRNQRESGANALVAGVALSLPLFDRNQGGLAEARAELEKTRFENSAARSEARAALAEAWQNLAGTRQKTLILRDDILPDARSAFESLEYGYREGKFDFLQLLDGQRTLFDLQGRYLESLLEYQLARVELHRLAAAPLAGLLGPAPTALEIEVTP